MANVVGIYGSPRKGGNTDLLLDRALQGCQDHGYDIQRVYVRDLHIAGCAACDGCAKTGICIVKDDMHNVYKLIDDAEVIILSSPIFFYGLTSQIKALMDRSQAMWWKRKINSDTIHDKDFIRGRGYLIAVGATRGKNLFECAKLTTRYFFDALGIPFEGGCFFRGIESRGEIKKHPEALQEAYDLCRK
jgi:multimeric flavodoxin WrbA